MIDGDDIEADATPRVVGEARRRRRPWRKKAKRATVITHRWLSLVLGLVLVVIATTGAALVYSPEMTRWTNSSTFAVSHSGAPISMTKAMSIVAAAHPTFEPASVNLYGGLYEVSSVDDDAHPGFYGVDPGTGRITGYVNVNSGVMALLTQVHECFFTCDGYPAYIKVLNDHVPTLGMNWLKDITWSSFILGVSGLLLVFLAVSGIWLWWPGIKRLSRGFRVRTKKGRFARDYDLHQVIGMVAVPFLLMWGVTGASFEFHWVNTAWYAVTGGQQEADAEFSSNAVTGAAPADIGLDAAIAVGRANASSDATLVYVSLPSADDDTSYYDMWFSERLDQYRYGAY
ncbi:MAG TPA: PepSY-associated TM helix domain-containing protein, partial [Ilumatobacteraceae bacterium]